MINPIMHWNVRGVRSSCSRLKKLILLYKSKVLAVAKPFLDNAQLDVFRKLLGFDGGVSNENYDGKLWLF